MVCENCEKCYKQLTSEEELNDLYSIAKQILEVDTLTEKDLRNVVKTGAHKVFMEANENGKSVDEYLESLYVSIYKRKGDVSKIIE